MSDRTIGYILLVAGIIMMIYSATQIISVFTGKAKPIQVVTYGAQKGVGSTSMSDLIKQFQLAAGTANPVPSNVPAPQLFDTKAINDVINISIYYFIMQFLLGMGYRLSSLGVKMLRPIVVQVKNKKLVSVVEEDEKVVNKQT